MPKHVQQQKISTVAGYHVSCNAFIYFILFICLFIFQKVLASREEEALL